MDASGEVTVPPRLREVVARRLERLDPFDERLLAALAVVDDGFTQANSLAGAEGVDEALGEGRGGRRARVCAAATASGTRSCASSWPPGCPRGLPHPRGGSGAACQ